MTTKEQFWKFCEGLEIKTFGCTSLYSENGNSWAFILDPEHHFIKCNLYRFSHALSNLTGVQLCEFLIREFSNQTQSEFKAVYFL